MNNLKLYTKDGTEFDTSDYNIIAGGKRSNIFENKKDNKILKVYHDGLSYKNCINEKMFNDIKEINSNAIPKLGECLYHGKRSKIFPIVKAYTMECIEKDYTDVLTMNPGKFAIDVAGKLSILCDKLAEQKILLSTPKNGNYIINKKGIFINDPDNFKRSKSDNNYLCALENKKMALEYLKKLVNECAEYRYNLGDKSDQIKELFDLEVKSSTDLATVVYQALKEKQLIIRLKK